MKPILTPIVKRALACSICDLGQFSHEEMLQLNRAVRHGFLSKGKGGPFPILKRNREEDEADLRRAHMMDLARGTDKFFPWVPFQEVTA